MNITLLKKIKRQMLSTLIKRERKRLCIFKTNTFFKNIFTNIYYPSKESFLLILFGVIFLILLSHFNLILPSWLCFKEISFLKTLGYKASNHYQNLIAIHAGIGAIIFALLIFIAESLRDDETKDRSRVLLKESNLFPLTMAEILVFFIFIWGDVNLWSAVSVIAIGIFTICSLYRIIAVLLNKYRFSQKRAALLKERLQQSMDLAIDERIGDNILLSRLNDKDIKLEFYPFSVDNQSEYHFFNAEKFGIVTDIDLMALKEIADIVDSEARKNGFSFIGEKKPEGRIREESEIQESILKTLPKNNQRYITRKFNDKVDAEYRTLICVDKKIVKDDRKLRKLDSLVRRAFIIKPANNFTEEVGSEISGVKDQFITAIKNGHLGKVEELVDLYIELAEGFLEHIIKYGGAFSAEQAREERHSLLGGLKQVRWLSTDISDLFEKAIQNHDLAIIDKVAYLPKAIARRAVEKNDHYLFQEFIYFAEIFYKFSVKENDKDLKKYLIYSSWHYLKQISDVYIEYKLGKEDLKNDELESLKDFGIYIFVIFQNLLKHAFDNKDFENFEVFNKVINKLFIQFKHSEYLLKKQSKLEEIETEINTRRNQMYFGLTSWILDQFYHNKNDEIIRQFFNSIQSVVPLKIEDFTDTFLKAHNYDIRRFWGWSWWEKRVEGEVFSPQIQEKLERYYVVKSLSLLASKTDEDIKKIELHSDRELVYFAEGNWDLVKILDDIKTNSENWRFVLSENAMSKVDLFKELLSKAKDAQEKRELQIKRKQNISQKKVSEFMNKVIQVFNESAVLRDIFRNYKLIDDQKNKPIKDSKNRFGINIVEDKAIFFENWHVHFSNWGNNYGRDLASGENKYLFDEVAKNCREISREDFDIILSSFKNVDDIIIFATNVTLWQFFGPDSHLDTKPLEVKGFWRWYDFKDQSIPVFNTYIQNIENQILILNRNKLGKLIQLYPLNEGEDKSLLKNIFFMNVQAFSENKELIESFIKKPPEWLHKIGDEQKQQEYLQERVNIQIFERFEYHKSSNFEGYKLVLNG